MKQCLFSTLLLAVLLSVPAFANEQYLWLEAENGVEQNPIVKRTDANASDGAYLSSWLLSNEGQVTYTIKVPVEGEYKLWGRLRMPSHVAPFDVLVNGKAVRWSKNAKGTTAMWAWSDSGLSTYLSAGTHTIVLQLKEGGNQVHLDKLLLTTVSDFAPQAEGGSTALAQNVEKPEHSLASGFELSSL